MDRTKHAGTSVALSAMHQFMRRNRQWNYCWQRCSGKYLCERPNSAQRCASAAARASTHWAIWKRISKHTIEVITKFHTEKKEPKWRCHYSLAGILWCFTKQQPAQIQLWLRRWLPIRTVV